MTKGRSPPDESPIRPESLAEKSDAMARAFHAARDPRARDERPAQERVRRLPADGAERPPARPPQKPPASAPATHAPPPRPRHAPRSEVPPPPGSEAPTAVSNQDQLAVELDEFLREIKQSWRNFGYADRISLVSALLMCVGVWLPWVSDPAHSLELGLTAGGAMHLGIAVAALLLVWHGSFAATRRDITLSARERGRRYRRASMWLVLLGALSTLLGAYLLVMLGLQKDAAWPIDVHFGLYGTLAAGTGLSYGGYVRFSRRMPER